jgi:hypothetical protein
MAFRRKIVADAWAREIVVETDLAGLAQSKTLPGVLTGLPVSDLPDLVSGEYSNPPLRTGCRIQRSPSPTRESFDSSKRRFCGR